MNLEQIDAIIFDFGGVLINLSYQRTIDAFVALGLNNFEELYSQANQENLFDDFETGKVSAQYFVNRLLDYLPSHTTPNKVVAAWNAMILDVPQSTIDLLDALSAKKRLFLLSNTNEIHIPKAFNEWRKTSPLMPANFFEKVYLSHEINMRKPNAEIFEFVCNENELDPNRTLFIDDSIQHIEGAKWIGLHTYHLKEMSELNQLFS